MTPKKSLHRVLMTRISLVAIVVSIAVSALVLLKEQDKAARVAHDRALIRSGTLQILIQDQLDAPGLGDHAEIQRLLQVVSYKGVDLSFGYYVFARIFDSALTEIAETVVHHHEERAALSRHIASQRLVLADQKNGPRFTTANFDGAEYIHSIIPLTSSSGETVAYMEGFFAETEEAKKSALFNILGAVVLAVGTVFATTLLLYPVILKLLRHLERLSINLLEANLEMVGVVGSTIAKRDSETDSHNFRVTIYSVRLAEAVGLPDAMIRTLIIGAFLHDVGKIGISDNILLKPAALNTQEFEEIKKHVGHGLDIVHRSTWLKEASTIVGSHHEKYTGSGYPMGLRGEEIPVLARIFAVVDVFDALTSRRPYKMPLNYDVAIDIMLKGRVSHFDPAIFDVFVKISRPLYDRYGTADASRAREDLKAVIDRYYDSNMTAFFN
ncbi:MAG: HD-GYP domain-containing protein [Desulfobacterales bacterium]